MESEKQQTEKMKDKKGEAKTLKFQYCNNDFKKINPSPKLNRLNTLNELAMRSKNSKNMNKKDSIGSSLVSLDNLHKPQEMSRINNKLGTDMRSNRNKNRIRRFKTYCEKDFPLQISKNSSNITNYNINIKISTPKRTIISLEEQEKKKPVLRKSSKLYKIKNLVRIIRGIIEPEVKRYDEISQLAHHIEEKKNRNNTSSVVSNYNNSFLKYMDKPDMDKELTKVHLKERVYKLITSGCEGGSIKEEINDIFIKNHDRYFYDADNSKFLFNQHLPDGKTLFYHACAEGNAEVVKIFLEKNMNPSIQSKNNENEEETCLQVAARWGYNEIVNLILQFKREKITKEEIEKTMKIKGIKQTIVTLLKEHIKMYHKNKKRCSCF